MNKEQFMRELDRLLQGIPESERKEALSYYEEYFEDAGVENEQQVLSELGTPDKIAENIRESLRGSMGNQNMGSGYQNTGYQQIGTQNVYTAPTQEKKDDKMPAWAIVLLVIGGIIASPLIIGALGSLLGTVISVIVSILAGILGLGAAGIALIIAGLASLVLGVTVMFSNVFAGLFLCGIGFLAAAIGLLFMIATVWLCGYALPTFVKWVYRLCKKPFEKKTEEVVA